MNDAHSDGIVKMQRVHSLRKERNDRVGNEVTHCEAEAAEVEAAESTRYHKPKPPPWQGRHRDGEGKKGRRRQELGSEKGEREGNSCARGTGRYEEENRKRRE